MREFWKMFWAALAWGDVTLAPFALGLGGVFISFFCIIIALYSPTAVWGVRTAVLMLGISVFLILFSVVVREIARWRWCEVCSLDELTAWIAECYEMAQRKPDSEEVWLARRRIAWNVFLPQ